MNLGGLGGAPRRQAECIRWKAVRGVEQTCAGLRVTRVPVRRPDPDSETVAPGARPAALALVLAMLVFVVLVSWFLLQRVKSVHGAASILCALMVATSDIASCFQMFGSATSGVAFFATGLVLAAHVFVASGHFDLDRSCHRTGLSSLRVAPPAPNIKPVRARSAGLLQLTSRDDHCSAFCFPGKCRAMEAESASALLHSAPSLVLTVPIIIIGISR
jgi:hypothetical protein